MPSEPEIENILRCNGSVDELTTPHQLRIECSKTYGRSFLNWRDQAKNYDRVNYVVLWEVHSSLIASHADYATQNAPFLTRFRPYQRG